MGEGDGVLPEAVSAGSTPGLERALFRRLMLAGALCALFGGAPGVAHATGGYFAGPTNITTGGGPTSVAVANLDGDLDPDLAVTSPQAQAISVHHGSTGAGFTGPTNFAACCGPRGIAVGDFDADLDQDLAAASGSEANVQIHVNDGSGVFTGPTKYLTGSVPRFVAVGNFNADLDPDLAVVSAADGTIWILFGALGATFVSGPTLTAGTGPQAVTVADFDGDLDSDLATANFGSGNTSIHLGDGAGNFTGPTNISSTGDGRSIVTGDFNGDLDPDLAVASFGTGVRILLGGAGASFSAPTTVSVGATPRWITVGQFNGDTDPDLATANGEANTVSVVLGGAGGSFSAPAIFGAGDFTGSIATGDFNGDADPDLAAANANSDKLSTLLGAIPPPVVAVDDVSHVEGDSGTTTYTFTVSRMGVTTGASSVHIAAQDGSATEGDNDYEPASADLAFATGETSKTFDVTTNGDTTFEPDESFNVKLSSPVNATISDDTGVGTIQNDDSQPAIAIDDVTHTEGNSGTTDYTFAVSLSNASSEQVDVSAQTQNGSATTADSDYAALAATTVSFTAGDTSEQVTVQANGDTTFEPDESFNVKLSSPVNAMISDDTGVGTIQNDDPEIVTSPFGPEADAHVQQANSSTNFGTSAFLRTDGGNDLDVESFLRFNLTGVSGSIQSAKLRVFATTGTVDGPAAYKTGNTWSESGSGGITWNTRPARTSGAVDDKEAIAAGSYVEFDVESLITGNGLYSFVLATTSTDEVDFSSREAATVAQRPQLIVVSGPDTTDPNPPSGLTASVSGGTRVNLSWTAESDDFGVTGYRIYRNGSPLATIGAQATYTDSATAGGNTYSYQVTALDAAGNESAPSNTATATTRGKRR